jgi:ATP-binding cassette subfamily F protein uup
MIHHVGFMTLIALSDVTVSFGGCALLDAVSLTIEPKERVCLVGLNGVGKSTLLKLIAKEMAPNAGEVVYQRAVRATMLVQEAPILSTGTSSDVVREGFANRDAGDEEKEYLIETVLSRLGLKASSPCASLSGGQRRRLLLARALVSEPDVLLLDEPTNHLDIDSIVWLESFLKRFPGAIVFITHDRMFTDRLATRILDLDRGELTSFQGGYQAYLAKKRDALEAEKTQRDKFDKRLAEEEAWLRKGIKARRTRNEGRANALLKMREEARLRRERQGTAKLQIEAVGRTAKKVIEARNATFGYIPEEPVIRDFSSVVYRGDKVGIIGANGVGKTTLIKLLLGELTPQQGEVRLGEKLEVAYLDQLREQLDYGRSVWENIVETGDSVVVNGQLRHIYTYLEDFLFTPERARSPAEVLSGGERNRLLLAKLFTRPANVLVLDEPTNDLDSETLELLEELLIEYSGTVLLVSHDRTFLNNVVASTLVFGEQGRISEYVGGYDDWLSQRPQPIEEKRHKPAKEKRKREKSAKQRDLTFKERFELDALPSAIEVLEAEQRTHLDTLADPSFYRTSGGQVAAVKSRLEAIEIELASGYDRWAELEAIRELHAKR